MRFVVVTGPSGAGKTFALHSFEDAGYYTVDNLPPRLLPALAAFCREAGHERAVAVVDARCGAAFAELPDVLRGMETAQERVETLFLDANDAVLVQRYKETRRPHPLLRTPGKAVSSTEPSDVSSGAIKPEAADTPRDSILEAMQVERALLEAIRPLADNVLDTSALSTTQLRDIIHATYAPDTRPGLLVTVVSFGFKHGMPIDADLVFDVRFLRNPHYVPALKALNGRDEAVACYVHDDPLTRPFQEKMTDLVRFTLPQYEREGKVYLNIAIGCTGGRHRSVVLTEDLAEQLREAGYHVAARHRDIAIGHGIDAMSGSYALPSASLSAPAASAPTNAVPSSAASARPGSASPISTASAVSAVSAPSADVAPVEFASSFPELSAERQGEPMNRLRTSMKWLEPGMYVKRWVGLGFVGLLAFLVGMGVIMQAHEGVGKPLAVRVAYWLIHDAHIGLLKPGHLGVLLTLIGAGICFFAFGKLIQSLTSALDPEMARGGLVDVIYQHRKLTRGRRIVVIGGGTGLSTMLRGLKRYSANITAIVTVADDGGSSGKLQKQLHILPPGDIRNCLVALADAEPQMTELFQYRFRNSVKPEGMEGKEGKEGKREAGKESALPPHEAQRSTLAAGGGIVVPSLEAAGVVSENQPAKSAPKLENREGYGEGLRDHAFGNLLIAAMCAINEGDFERGVQETSRVLNVRGQVLPTTVDHVSLRGEMEDGSFVDGETNIAHSPLKIKRIHMVPPDACPLEAVLEAIAKADIIVLGPGSVYTSIIPNLLVRGVPEALRRSKAKKVYACNVMTQPGETDGYSASDHVRAIESHAGMRIFNYVLVNTQQPDITLLEKYRKTGSVLVEPDLDRLKADGYRSLPGDYINETDVVRHDAGLLASAIMRLIDG